MNLLVRRRVLWDYLAGALWILPTISVLVFLAAGALLSRVSISDHSPLAFQGSADDARKVLIVVSTTMITVTGLVFALTIVALQIASGQYSPRLLRNFMRDRGTQVVLSVFVGAFAYSTAGLYTVGTQRAGEQAFVPRLAVSGSLGLALASVGVLIYFIHHLARSIQIDSIMSQIQRETREVIDDVYPHPAGGLEPEERCPDPPPRPRSCRQPPPATSRPSSRPRWSRPPPATTWSSGSPDGSATTWWPAPRWPGPGSAPPTSHHPPALLEEAVADAVHIGFERTMVQDVLFGLRRLVDIANRALSPAVNDPYTAIQAVHHLSVLLCVLARRRLGDQLCRDQQGTLRVAVPLPDFDEYLRRSTAQIRRFGAAEPALMRSLIELLRDVGTSTASDERRAACAHHLWLVLKDAKRETAQPDDLQAVVEDGAAALSTLGADHPQIPHN